MPNQTNEKALQHKDCVDGPPKLGNWVPNCTAYSATAQGLGSTDVRFRCVMKGKPLKTIVTLCVTTNTG